MSTLLKFSDLTGIYYPNVIIAVDNLQQLQEIVNDEPSAVFVKGFHTPDDGGGGSFWWDETRAKTDHNGGTIIDPGKLDQLVEGVWPGTWFTPAESGIGCWVRNGSRRLAEEFGVRSTGDQTAAMTASINAFAAGDMYLPNYPVNVSGPHRGVALTLPVAGIRIFGTGSDSEIRLNQADTIGSTIIGATDSDFVVLRDFGINGQRAARVSWDSGIRLFGVRDFDISGLRLYDVGGSAIVAAKSGTTEGDLQPASTRRCEQGKITGNTITRCYSSHGIGTKLGAAKKIIIKDNIITDASTTAISIEGEGAVDFASGVDEIVCTGNVIDHPSYLYSTDGTTCWGISITEHARKIVCNGNIISNVEGLTAATGIMISTSPSQDDSPCSDISVQGNIIFDIASTSGGDGITVSMGDANIERLIIANNIITNVTNDGCRIITATGSFTVGTLNKFIVNGNIINECQIGLLCEILSGGDVAINTGNISANVITGVAVSGMNLKINNAAISGNTLESADGSADGRYAIIGTYIGCLISNNVITGVWDTGIRGDHTNGRINNNVVSATAEYGIYQAGGTGTPITENRVSLSTYGVRGVSGATIRNNSLEGCTTPLWGSPADYNTGTFDAFGNQSA